MPISSPVTASNACPRILEPAQLLNGFPLFLGKATIATFLSSGLRLLPQRFKLSKSDVPRPGTVKDTSADTRQMRPCHHGSARRLFVKITKVQVG